ncbi:hypothetical protein PSYMO_31452, partial [Pseudomonas amygdali pv. mori str. 301020]
STPAAPAPPVKRPSFTPDPNASGGYGLAQTTDGVDFKLYGAETQFVELELDPGESAVAEAGAMMYKTCDVQMETIFGDGSNQSSGLLGSLFGAGKRMLTGESLFTTVFSQQGSGKGRVAFAAPYPGTILPLNLRDFGGYRNWSWKEPAVQYQPDDDPRLKSDLTEQRIRQSISEQLDQRGLRMATTGARSDLKVQAWLIVENRQQTVSTNYGGGWDPWGG